MNCKKARTDREDSASGGSHLGFPERGKVKPDLHGAVCTRCEFFDIMCTRPGGPQF